MRLIDPPAAFLCPYCKVNTHEYDGTGACQPCAKEHKLKPKRYNYQLPKPKKVYEIPKESEKRKVLNRIDRKQNKELREKVKHCQVKSPVCTGRAEGTQHIEGRKEGNLIDPDKKMVSCNACNVWCEAHPLEAAELRVAGSKHRTVKKVRDILDKLNNN